jgi:hypothetical protein
MAHGAPVKLYSCELLAKKITLEDQDLGTHLVL